MNEQLTDEIVEVSDELVLVNRGIHEKTKVLMELVDCYEEVNGKLF